ncbi:hypothetical protein C1T31_10165 [Hanstruepera neustonica]|uniref:Peptidase M61 catalytic domain-containing protein n=1 Tax=Hanstruepera neustonica TaxID=1445657 RepID=A0A2K1DXW9_9FLAO|nr:hypothetical protein [Hanstruepera neustonica]PNQ72860.1 hypothetical protein C1T31_10165 [Hanstruepera neustonica]
MTNKKINLKPLIVTVLMLLIAMAAHAVNPKTQYTITIKNLAERQAHIRYTFMPKSDTLSMAPGANQLPDRWATFISNVKLQDSNNQEYAIQDLDNATWLMRAPHNQTLTLSYTVNLTHEDYTWSSGLDGVAFNTDWGIFATTRALLIVNGNQHTNITVTCQLPKDWKLTTTWQRTPHTNNQYHVSNTEELTQSMLFMGYQEEIIIEKDHLKLIFALGGESVIAKKDFYANMASGVLEYYENLMGGLPKLPSATFAVFINTANATDGEVIGNNISILIEQEGDAMSEVIANFIFAHEFFHLWNGKTFLPVDETMEWFKEGFTNYYTLKALYQIGYLNQDSFTGALNNLFYNKYHHDEGLGTIAMVQGDQKHDHWGLIYGGGLFAGIAQDINIRLNSHNTHSLDDLMRDLYTNHAGADKAYTMQDLKNKLESLNGSDLTTFFQDYIYGTKTIPIADYLTQAGFDAQIEGDQLIKQPQENASGLQQAIIQGIFGLQE